MKDWKTSLAGAVLAVLTFLGTYQANGGNLTDWKLWAIPAAIAFLGYIMKDAAGGKVQCNPIACLAALVIACVGMTSCVTTTAPDGSKTRTLDRDQFAFWSAFGVHLYKEIKAKPEPAHTITVVPEK